MAELKLTRGLVATIDDADLDKVAVCAWYAHLGWGNLVYARNDRFGYLHRYLLQCPQGLFVDHINGDGLDNRRANLRQVTKSQNGYNRGKARHNTSGFKGVMRAGDRWEANIVVEGRRRYLGRFATPEEAAQAYDTAARLLHGNFAKLNEVS